MAECIWYAYVCRCVYMENGYLCEGVGCMRVRVVWWDILLCPTGKQISTLGMQTEGK